MSQERIDEAYVERYAPVFFAKDLGEWRAWLEEHGKAEKGIFLVVFKKASRIESIGWHEAIEHALCYGWVDSIAHTRDETSTYLKFTPRNPKSRWGMRNIERAKKLIAGGYMRPEGMRLIELAKANGYWEEPE